MWSYKPTDVKHFKSEVIADFPEDLQEITDKLFVLDCDLSLDERRYVILEFNDFRLINALNIFFIENAFEDVLKLNL